MTQISMLMRSHLTLTTNLAILVDILHIVHYQGILGMNTLSGADKISFFRGRALKEAAMFSSFTYTMEMCFGKTSIFQGTTTRNTFQHCMTEGVP